jgi:hypothetical protein
VFDAVIYAVDRAGNDAVSWAVYLAVNRAVYEAVREINHD